MNKIEYRPDIDGLRAIAVLSVLLHHLSASFVPGGFVGVDIFFVISGYLISSQIYKDASQGTFSIRQFYQRRINRIIPALATMITATLVVGWVVLSPRDLILVLKSSIFAMLGMSNVFFWREYGDYFGGNAAEAPLLHTWSLGVEEQFYLIWPLLVVLLIKLRRRYVIGGLAALTLMAGVVSEIAIGFAASASYYLLPTRFFELMIGGTLALIVAHKTAGARAYSGLIFSVGLVLIVWSLFGLSKTSSFPGVNAVWPCAGTALLIWSGNAQHPFSRVLTNRPIVFIGLISYSLYLWHWPIISYLTYMDIAVNGVIGSYVIFASILLAWLSWKFVEIPLRRTGAVLAFSAVLIRRFALPLVALFSLGLAAIYTKGFPERFDPRVAKFELSLDAKPDVLRSGCHVPSSMYDTPPNLSKCKLGSDNPRLDGILIGDSYANHFTGMIDIMAKAQGLSFIDYTMDGCPPILGYEIDHSSLYQERCLKRNEAAYALVLTKDYGRVVLASSWPKTAKAGEQLMASIATVLDTGAQLTLIVNNESIARASSCPIRRIMYGTAISCESQRQGAPEYFSEIRNRYPSVHIIDPNLVVCDDDKCSPTLGDALLYRDDGHLNDVGSRLIGQSLLGMGIHL